MRTALSRAERTGTSVALLYLDLDNFKHVNDTLGHEQGDRLLHAMAARFREAVRGEDSVARLGGDEFVIILEDVSDPAQPARLAEKLIAAVAEPVRLGGFELRMRASIGISLGPAHGATSEELLKAADAAMYRAKRGGRGRYEFFSAELTRQALERLTLENAMRDPLFYDQLVLQYQPQVAVAGARLIGVEGLLRWRHPTRGLLDPSVFIPMAEDAGLIPAIGEWVLRTACRQARAWLDAGYAPIRIAVNVSAYQIKAASIVDTVHSALSDTGLDPALLELEITEGA
jgi:diguanylate cyclase (GGDEF)-like protein